jgi:hypothetical protein
MSVILRRLERTSWIQRLFLLVLGCNVVLLPLGLHVVPADLHSVQGLGVLLATMGLQAGLALLALMGPVAFDRYSRTMGISLGFGVLFAVAYLGILACEFAGIQLSFDTGSGTIYALFVSAALFAAALASLRTQRLRDGVVASCWALVIGTAIWSLGVLVLNYALWGSPHWYAFWQGDGAIDDFRQSGSTDLAVFLLQDLQGALFFHPMLSAVIGAIGGLVGGGLVCVPAALWRLLGSPILRNSSH